MKWLSLLAFLLVSQVGQAQIICPGAPLKTITYQYLYNGTCCNVQMSYYECVNLAGDCESTDAEGHSEIYRCRYASRCS